MSDTCEPVQARVLIGATDGELRDKLLGILAAWPEFQVIDVCSDLDALIAAAARGTADLVIVDALVCQHGIAHDVESITAIGVPVVVFTSRGSYPAVVELAGGMAVRAITLPRWVLDENDDLTASHTRALLLDLTPAANRWASTIEFDSPEELEAAENERRSG